MMLATFLCGNFAFYTLTAKTFNDKARNLGSSSGKKCWHLYDEGNGKCGSGTSGKYVLDEWGRDNEGSFENEEKCLGRKQGHDAYCGTYSKFCYRATAEECESNQTIINLIT